MKLQLRICLATALSVLALTGLTLSTSAEGKAATVNPTGNWKWNVPNPDGQIPDIKITLKLQGESLTGTVTKGSGTTAITNGVCKGDNVSFQTIRESKSGKGTTTYTGKLSGDTIRGKVEINAGGKTLSSDWEIKRIKE
jgi:hypothetical protein